MAAAGGTDKYNHPLLCKHPPKLHVWVQGSEFTRILACGQVAVSDLHGDIVARCGRSYTTTGKCALQVPAGVHYEFEGRQFGALSVVRKLLEVQWGLGNTTDPRPRPSLTRNAAFD